MADQHTAVVGVYSNVPDADRAVYELLQRASLIVEVSVLSAAGHATLLHPWINARLARGASAGSVVGATAGAAVGLLAGAGIVAIPLFASFTAAGPVVATLAGAVAGAMVGSLIGALIGGSRSHAGTTDAATAQNVVLAVHCGSSEDIERARTVLQETGAAEIAEKPESMDADLPSIP